LGEGRLVLSIVSIVERIPAGRHRLSSGMLTLHGSLFNIQNSREVSFRDELL
jgi:hypothetical protein